MALDLSGKSHLEIAKSCRQKWANERPNGIRCVKVVRPYRGPEYCDERVCVCACLSAIISSSIFIKFFMLHTYGRGHLDAARSSSGGVMTCYVFTVLWMTSYLQYAEAARRRRQAEERGSHSHAGLGLARRNTCCRQRTLGTISCRQGLLGRSGRVEYL